MLPVTGTVGEGVAVVDATGVVLVNEVTRSSRLELLLDAVV